MFLEVAVHSLYIFESETCCEYGYLYAASQFRVNGKTHFSSKSSPNFSIKSLTSFIIVHGQARIIFLLACKCDAEQNLLRVEYVIIVKER